MPVCVHCNNDFISSISLYNHQRKAKYCIDIQKQKNIDMKVYVYTCKWCDKLFNSKYNYERHVDCCKIKFENETTDIELTIKNQSEEITRLNNLLEEKKSKIEILEKRTIRMDQLKSKIKVQQTELEYQKCEIEEQKLKIVELSVRLEDKTEMSNEFKELHSKKDDCIEKIAMQPKSIQTQTTSNQNTSNQNILNNLPIFNITKEQLQKAAETDFSMELFLQGQAGVAKFTIGVFRQAHDDGLPWIVSDQARDIFKTKDKDGNIVVDPQALRLTAMVMEAVKEKNQQHHDSFYPKRDYKSDDERDEAEIDRVGKIELDAQIRADDCYMDILNMKRDNKVFRKKLKEACKN